MHSRRRDPVSPRPGDRALRPLLATLAAVVLGACGGSGSPEVAPRIPGPASAAHAARFLALVTPVRVVVYGSPSAALKEALALLDPVYMQPTAGFRR